MNTEAAVFTYTINFLGSDREKIRELEQFQTETGRLSFLFSREPLPERDVDVYVVPVDTCGEFLKQNKPSRTWLPVLAYGDPAELSMAFECGCTDYLKNPWEPEELLYRVERNVKNRFISLPWGRISIAPHLAASPFGSVKLSIQEFSILKVLAQKQGDVVPREELYKVLWGKIREQSRVVDMHISSLRKKIQTLLPLDFDENIIKSAHGHGYFIPFPVPFAGC